jgi:hypothetical protein
VGRRRRTGTLALMRVLTLLALAAAVICLMELPVLGVAGAAPMEDHATVTAVEEGSASGEAMAPCCTPAPPALLP